VSRCGKERAEDEEIEGALEQFNPGGRFGVHCVERLLHTL
jgi:hypothetical protein